MAVMHDVKNYWGEILSQNRDMAKAAEWVGIFENLEAQHPYVVWLLPLACQLNEHIGWQALTYEPRLFSINNSYIQHLSVMPVELCQEIIVPNRDNGSPWYKLMETATRVRVSIVRRGLRRLEIPLYYGRVDRLVWDPRKFAWKWGAGIPIMEFSTKVGIDIVRQYHNVPSVVEKK